MAKAEHFNTPQQQHYYISPHDYYNRKYIFTYIQQMIGVLKVKNAREPVKRKDI